MALFGKSPINGPSEYLNNKFQEWWYVLNSIGLFSFTLLIGSMGCGNNRYFAAAISSAVVGWLLYIAMKFFPELVKVYRKSNDPIKKDLARRIDRDYFGVLKMPVAYLPYMVGVIGLWVYAANPLITNQYHLYVPKF